MGERRRGILVKSTLSEADVARILNLPPESVHRLFEHKVLTGYRTDDAWETTDKLLDGDITILTEQGRMEKMANGAYTSPWAQLLADGEIPGLTLEAIDGVLNMLDRQDPAA